MLVDAGPTAAAASAAAIVAAYDAAPPPKKVVVCAPGPGVDFHGDVALESEVRRKLGKDAGTITQGDLKTIKSVNISQAQVDSLDPCVWPLFTGVHDVFLGRGDLQDSRRCRPSRSSSRCARRSTASADITPLAKMTKLDRLDLGRTAVHDITPLANLTALTELQLDDTQVVDLTPLAPLKNLEKLSIRNTPVVDLSPLKDHKKLRFLYIEGAPIADTNVLAPLVASGLHIMRKGQL